MKTKLDTFLEDRSILYRVHAASLPKKLPKGIDIEITKKGFDFLAHSSLEYHNLVTALRESHVLYKPQIEKSGNIVAKRSKVPLIFRGLWIVITTAFVWLSVSGALALYKYFTA